MFDFLNFIKLKFFKTRVIESSRQRKINIPSHEKENFKAGDQVLVIKTEEGKKK